jgi:hypothetical protein
MPIMVERASNADRARYVLRTSPSAHRRKDRTIKIFQEKDHKTPEGGPNLSIKVGQTGLSKAHVPSACFSKLIVAAISNPRCCRASIVVSLSVSPL